MKNAINIFVNNGFDNSLLHDDAKPILEIRLTYVQLDPQE